MSAAVNWAEENRSVTAVYDSWLYCPATTGSAVTTVGGNPTTPQSPRLADQTLGNALVGLA